MGGYKGVGGCIWLGQLPIFWHPTYSQHLLGLQHIPTAFNSPKECLPARLLSDPWTCAREIGLWAQANPDSPTRLHQTT